MMMIFFYKVIEWGAKALDYLVRNPLYTIGALALILILYISFCTKRPTPVPVYDIQGVQKETEKLQENTDQKVGNVLDNTRQRQEEGNRKIANVKRQNVTAKELEEKLK